MSPRALAAIELALDRSHELIEVLGVNQVELDPSCCRSPSRESTEGE